MRIIPPPTPVPNVTQTILLLPWPAPRHISPTAAALASFSKRAGSSSWSLRRVVRLKLSSDGRFGAFTIVPCSTLTVPGTTTETAEIRPCALPSHSRTAATSASTIASGVSSFGVLCLIRKCIRPYRSTNAARRCVPPRSAAKTEAFSDCPSKAVLIGSLISAIESSGITRCHDLRRFKISAVLDVDCKSYELRHRPCKRCRGTCTGSD